MGSLARVVGRGIGLAFVAVIVAAITGAACDAIGLPHAASGVVEWTCAAAATATTWYWWRKMNRWLRARELETRRAAGEELRREDYPRYRELLEGSTDALAHTDPDLYVGRNLPEPEREPVRIRQSAWEPASPEQKATVEELSARLGRAILVRSLDDGSAEVVGVNDSVGYTYRVDRAGVETLVSRDESTALWGRRLRRAAGVGLLMFVGSFITTFVLDHSGRIPGWLVPFTIVGFVLMFFGMAGNVQPKTFVDGGVWRAHGNGWD